MRRMSRKLFSFCPFGTMFFCAKMLKIAHHRFWVQGFGSGFRVLGSGFGVQGFGFRVLGFGC